MNKYNISFNYKQYSDSDDGIISSLTKLCKLFEDCYKDATKKKSFINITINYSIINEINNFITEDKKTKNMTDKITNTLFNIKNDSN